MHPGRTAEITVGDTVLGYVGEIHPLVAENYNIGAKVYVAVMDMKALEDTAELVKKYKVIPKFPAVTRDISLVVKDDVYVKDIEKCIKANAGKILEKVTLFDVYQGSHIEKGFKSVSYSIMFRAADRTLVDSDVNNAMEKILTSLEKELGAVLRDK